MNRNFKTSSITESAMMAGIMVIIAYLSSFISILMFFYPTPAIILGKRNGLKYSVLSLIAADIIIFMLLGVQTGFGFLVLYTPLAIALTYGVCNDQDANKTILFGSAAYMISFVIFIFALDAIMGINFIERIGEMYEQSFEMTKNFFTSMPDNVRNEQMEQTISQMDELMPAVNFLIANIFPAVIVVSSVLTSYINYFVASKFARRFSIDIKEHEGISFFSFPKNFMVAMAVLLLLSFLLAALNINVEIIQLNLFFITFMAMLVQGFAVLKFFIDKGNFGKVGKTIMLVLVVFLSFQFGIFYSILGLVDLTFDIRKIKRAV